MSEETTQVPTAPSPSPEAKPVDPNAPVQVDKATFLAARLREALAESANLRTQNARLHAEVAGLRAENAELLAVGAQQQINVLDKDYDVGDGTRLQARSDGTYWRLPKPTPQQGQ